MKNLKVWMAAIASALTISTSMEALAQNTFGNERSQCQATLTATNRNTRITLRSDTEARIKSLYPGQIDVTEHPFEQRGHYLIFLPKDNADKNYRIVFETDGNRVTNFRSGKLPEVEYPDGCS